MLKPTSNVIVYILWSSAVSLHQLVRVYLYFMGPYCFHLLSEVGSNKFLLSVGTKLPDYKVPYPEDHNMTIYHHENFKSCAVYIILLNSLFDYNMKYLPFLTVTQHNM
jgi:hypothetical protein